MTAQTGRTAGRFLRSLAIGEGHLDRAQAYLAGQNWLDRSEVDAAIKSTVSGLGFDDISSQPVGEDFLAALRPLSILGRLTAARHVALRVRVIVFGAGTRASVVAAGAAIPLSKASIAGEVIEPVKVAGLTVLTGETLAMSGGVAADRAIAADLAKAVALAEDVLFIDPTQPGSALYGTTAIASTGTTLAQIDADLAALVDALIAGGSTLLSAAWVMSSHTATKLALIRGSSGVPAFPDIGATGGLLLKMPVVVSDSATNSIVLLDQAGGGSRRRRHDSHRHRRVGDRSDGRRADGQFAGADSDYGDFDVSDELGRRPRDSRNRMDRAPRRCGVHQRRGALTMANLFVRDELHEAVAQMQRKAMASTESVPFTAGLAAFFFEVTTRTAAHLAKNAQALHDKQEETIAALVKRIDELESARSMIFEGPFDPSKSYKAGATVQRGNALWVSLVATNEQPGQSAAWRRVARDQQ